MFDFIRLRSSSNPMFPPRRAKDVNPWILVEFSDRRPLLTTLRPPRQTTNRHGSRSASSRRRGSPIKFHSKISKINCRHQVVISNNPSEPGMLIPGSLSPYLSGPTHRPNASFNRASKRSELFGAMNDDETPAVSKTTKQRHKTTTTQHARQ